ncbi:MAG: hypothetical protein QOJ84_412 [Bradyrhizobium sp.]|jgi:hypothetical protein|nr:hypothetical protein [Bradyrhizobium sp.]
MKFSQWFLDEIRSRLPVSQIVGQRVKLKKVGSEWRGLSPFGPEKSPSFTVNDDKGFFHDFITGKHGDIFDFLVEDEKISHSVAVARLAVIAGFTSTEILQHELSSEVRSSSEVRAWLELQSHQVAIVYAARSALRAIPHLASLRSFTDEDENIRRLILSCFRADAAAWTIARYPSDRSGLHRCAKTASDAVLSAAGPWLARNPANRAAGRASAAAARAAKSARESGSSAASGIEEIFTQLYVEIPNSRAEFETIGASTDIELLDSGFDPNDIIQHPLWINRFPAEIQSDWEELEARLLSLNEDWFVWTEWYWARLRGDVANKTAEISRTKLKASIWKQPPATVNSKIKEIISKTKLELSNALVPLDNVPSPFAFQISETGKIDLASSPSNSPQFPFLNSQREQTDRLNVCRTLAQDLISDLKGRRFQARPEYVEGFEKYADRLPSDLNAGNFLLAEAEARTLRNLFAAEASIISVAFAAKLKTFLEQHMGLRVFYPDVANFYRDVRSGRMIEPLPLDAVEGVLNGVKENTPTVFEPTVQEAIQGSLKSASVVMPVNAGDQPAIDATQLLPPNDPLGDIDPHKAADFTFAGATNGIWKAFLQGEKIHKALEGWAKTRTSLAPHVSEILGWLHRLMAANDGVPPGPPNISI